MATTISDFYRGDTVTVSLTVTQNGVAYNLTGCTLWLTLKSKSSDADTSAIIQKKVTAHTNPSGGISAITMTAAETDLITPKIYAYDVQLKTATGQIYTLNAGTVACLADITRSIT